MSTRALSPRLCAGCSRSRLGGRLANFAAIGAVCTVAFALLYSGFRTVLNPVEANVSALSITMLVNFAANRWLTFGGGSRSLFTEAAQYAVVYALGLACSSAVLATALATLPTPPPLLETLLAIGAGAVATAIRFLLLSAWVFRPAPAPGRDRTVDAANVDFGRGG